MTHTYKLKYELKSECGEFKEEDPNGAGLTDAVILISMIYGESGTDSQQVSSVDGRKGGAPLKAIEKWEAWYLLTFGLAEDPDLPFRPPRYFKSGCRCIKASCYDPGRI